MKEIIKDCLSCSRCVIVVEVDSMDESTLFCTVKQETVEEDGYCEEYN